MDNIIFYEEQRFNQPWIWVLLVGLNLLIGWGVIQQLAFEIPWGTNPAPDAVLISIQAMPILLLILFIVFHLKTIISQDKINIIFVPFVNKTIRWKEVEKAYIRQYKPLMEYGGWGIRRGLSGRAYNVKGKTGLQLQLKSGKKILIGTQKGEELKRLLDLLN